jgi:hypothetical protein
VIHVYTYLYVMFVFGVTKEQDFELLCPQCGFKTEASRKDLSPIFHFDKPKIPFWRRYGLFIFAIAIVLILYVGLFVLDDQ